MQITWLIRTTGFLNFSHCDMTEQHHYKDNNQLWRQATVVKTFVRHILPERRFVVDYFWWFSMAKLRFSVAFFHHKKTILGAAFHLIRDDKRPTSNGDDCYYVRLLLPTVRLSFVLSFNAAAKTKWQFSSSKLFSWCCSIVVDVRCCCWSFHNFYL